MLPDSTVLRLRILHIVTVVFKSILLMLLADIMPHRLFEENATFNMSVPDDKQIKL